MPDVRGGRSLAVPGLSMATGEMEDIDLAETSLRPFDAGRGSCPAAEDDSHAGD